MMASNELCLVYKLQIESVTAISHYMPSCVHFILIIAILHVFGNHFGSTNVFANIACKLYISDILIVATPKIRPKTYVPKWITNGVMAVFMFAAAILAAILNISISPRGPEWGMRWIMNK